MQRAAKDSTSAIYFAYPVQDGLMDATAAMAIAAREAGVSRLVNLVMLQSSPDAPTPRMRQNYLSEQVFEWAGSARCTLRATVFYENLGAMARQSLPARAGGAAGGRGSENTVLPMIAAEDVARVAVGLLTSETLVAGTAYPLIGTTISLKEIIATFGRVLAKDIRYEEISDDEWKANAASRGYDEHAIARLSSLWKALRSAAIDPADARYTVSQTIETIGGARTKSFETFVREGQSELLAKAS